MATLTQNQLTGGPSVADFLGQMSGNRINTNTLSMANKNAGLRSSLSLGAFAAPQGGLNLGLANIANLIGTQGKLDPLALNLQLADIASNTQNTKDAARGELAAAGIQGGGVSQALLAGIDQAGGAARNSSIARNQVEARQRQAQELQGLLFPILQAIIEQQALAQGGDNARRQQKTQKYASDVNFWSSLLGSGAQLYGGG